MNVLSQKRIGRITGSAVGAILGLSPWQSADNVLRGMVRAWHGVSSDWSGNIATEYGHAHEPLAKMDFLARTGELIEDCGFMVHPLHPWLGATPDGLVGLDGVAELKCPFGLRNDQDPQFKTALDQPHYYAQMQVEMHCAGRELCHFFQWSAHGDAYEIVRISEAWWDENLPKLKAFHARYLAELDNPAHLEPVRATVDGAQAAALLAEWDACKASIDAAEERRKAILAEIIALAKEQDADICGRKLTRVERKGAVDYSKIPALQGLDLEQYRRSGGEYWRLS
jgi:putative phage-type endonuclease